MPWLIEDLIGTKNGVNQDFTITEIPFPGSLIVIFNGMILELVGSQPELLEAAYVSVSDDIHLGIAPNVGQHLWARYFY